MQQKVAEYFDINEKDYYTYNVRLIFFKQRGEYENE